MTEDEARIALHKLYLKYKPDTPEGMWGVKHMEMIRRRGKGYWVKPEAQRYVDEVRRELANR
jgi:hypothetical protein